MYGNAKIYEQFQRYRLLFLFLKICIILCSLSKKNHLYSNNKYTQFTCLLIKQMENQQYDICIFI